LDLKIFPNRIDLYFNLLYGCFIVLGQFLLEVFNTLPNCCYDTLPLLLFVVVHGLNDVDVLFLSELISNHESYREHEVGVHFRFSLDRMVMTSFHDLGERIAKDSD
jgi:hypothetical protein